jgi:hypothetical protein
MNDLLNRMITRVTRPVSQVEPVLASRYEPTAPLDIPVIPELSKPGGVRTRIESAPVAEDRDEDADRSRDPSRAPEPPPFQAAFQERPEPCKVEKSSVEEIVDLANAAAIENKPRTDLTLLPPQERYRREIEVHTEVIKVQGVDASPGAIYPERPTVSFKSINNVPRTRAAHGVAEKQGETPLEVNVTIGHIEVRAAAPVKTPVRKTTPPRVSLDDYLNRRNGGAR